jgi:hypothetical protein
MLKHLTKLWCFASVTCSKQICTSANFTIADTLVAMLRKAKEIKMAMTVERVVKYLQTLPAELPVTCMNSAGMDCSVKHVNRMLSKDQSYDRVVFVAMGPHLNDDEDDEISGAI